MDKLHKCFKDAITHIGLAHKEMPMAVFYNASVGIRFEIGGNEKIYLPDKKGVNPIYVGNAFYRAKELYDNLPCCPNLLRIDSYPEESDSITLEMLSKIGLPMPDESVKETHFDEDICYIREHLYWDLTKGNCQIDKLLLEIIKGDVDGFHALCSNVYLLNTQCLVLYHLYDDRGVDIVAEKKASLLPLYQKYNDWILKYDKEEIDQIFAY